MTYGSVETVKARTDPDFETFGFANESELDAWIETNLEEASSAIDGFCRRSFGEQSVTGEEASVINATEIRVTNYPVTSITEIREGDTVVDEDDYRITPTSNMPDRNAGVIERTDGTWRRRILAGGPDIEVDYEFGFESVPPVVDSVANEMVINIINEAEAEIASNRTQSLSMDGYSVTFDVVDMAQKGAIQQAQLDRLRGLRGVLA